MLGQTRRVVREPSTSAWLWPFCLLVFAIVAVPVRMLDDAGLPRYRALRRELSDLQAGNDEARRELRALRRKVEGLRSDPTEVERIARDELGMLREGEIILQFE